MSKTDQPRHPGALIVDSDTDTEEVLPSTAFSDTEETPVTTAPLCNNPIVEQVCNRQRQSFPD